MKIHRDLSYLAALILLSCFAASVAHSADCGGTDADSIRIVLPPASQYPTLAPDTIWIPNHRPVYALMVHGYSQNFHFNQLMCYEFARHLIKDGAYVHYAWWNNLLAPYMARPLHQANSEPGMNSLLDIGGFVPLPWIDGTFGGKALPDEDYQFQADAREFLRVIREHNPSAMIILVGHSMGGASVVHLACSTDVVIDLLAPLDPVQNRGKPVGRGLTQEYNWTRWRIAYDNFLGYKQMACAEPNWLACQKCVGYGETWYGFNTLPWPHSLHWWCGITPFVHHPDSTRFNSNVINLYHRYQKEAVFPFDFLTDQHFAHDVPPGGSSLQAAVTTCWIGFNVLGWPCLNFDGHGEIVGFYGTDPKGLAAYNWPSRNDAQKRREYLKLWEAAPDSFHVLHSPPYRALCMVSDPLIDLYNSMNRPPVAHAGDDQIVRYTGLPGAEVTLDGSGSADPNPLDALSYSWEGPFGERSGQVITEVLELGKHDITLTVADSSGHIDCDKVEIRVEQVLAVDEGAQLPDQFALHQNQPNPFNASTTISFALPEAAQVTLEVFNVVGQQVAFLIDGQLGPGEHTVNWDMSRMSSGVYFYRLQAGEFVGTRKMMLVK